MTSTDVSSAVEVLRAFLTEDFSSYQRLLAGLDAGQRRAFSVALTAAFTGAATRRLGQQPPAADVIEFVAQARARYPRTAEAVPAEDAETVIRAALGEEDLIGRLDGRASGAAQIAMLFALTRDDSGDVIDALLATATAQAEDYLRRRANR